MKLPLKNIVRFSIGALIGFYAPVAITRFKGSRTDSGPVIPRVPDSPVVAGTIKGTVEELRNQLVSCVSIERRGAIFEELLIKAALSDLNVARRIWDDAPSNLPPMAKAHAIARLLREGDAERASTMIKLGWPMVDVLSASKVVGNISPSRLTIFASLSMAVQVRS